ncbi:hypothetical protein PC114_g22004 [Phytophthora cactorum]|uniref:Uncharacterized protein n=1 Tax=Phytophthora cactorum TaxID=29920 RepID=A0A8T1B1D1_9STRA|nr:hypothetical protein PC114_g22004 [Phytophthora cactorum]KAG2892644.1 hypothetical protein PC117_g23971 [Phytophthora cactorum]
MWNANLSSWHPTSLKSMMTRLNVMKMAQLVISLVVPGSQKVSTRWLLRLLVKVPVSFRG